MSLKRTAAHAFHDKHMSTKNVKLKIESKFVILLKGLLTLLLSAKQLLLHQITFSEAFFRAYELLLIGMLTKHKDSALRCLAPSIIASSGFVDTGVGFESSNN
jgi:hypothetical protein